MFREQGQKPDTGLRSEFLSSSESRGLFKLPGLRSGPGSGRQLQTGLDGKVGLSKGSESGRSGPDTAQVGENRILLPSGSALWPAPDLQRGPGASKRTASMQDLSPVTGTLLRPSPKAPKPGHQPDLLPISGTGGEFEGGVAGGDFVCFGSSPGSGRGTVSEVGSKHTPGRCGQQLSAKGAQTAIPQLPGACSLCLQGHRVPGSESCSLLLLLRCVLASWTRSAFY